MRSRSLLCIIVALSSAAASAASVTWTLNDVKFNDGGTATGSVTLTSDGSSLLNYDITVSGGDTSNFPVFRYANGAPYNTSSQYYYDDSPIYGAPAWDFVFNTNYGAPWRELRIAVLDWSSGNGIAALYMGGNYAAECYNCNPYRTVVSGYLKSSDYITPEPATCMVAVPVLGLIFRRRLQRGMGWAERS